MMPLVRYVARRIVFVVPQLFGIVLVSFFLVKLIPGDPAVMMLGPTASAQSLAELRDKMGFTKPCWNSSPIIWPMSRGAIWEHRGRPRAPSPRICSSAFPLPSSWSPSACCSPSPSDSRWALRQPVSSAA